MYKCKDETSFIEFIKNMIDLNHQAAVDSTNILTSEKTDKDRLIDDPEICEKCARDAMLTSATDMLLRRIFNGVIATIDSEELTDTQKKFINYNFAAHQQELSLTAKQELLKYGITQHGVGTFYNVDTLLSYKGINTYDHQVPLASKVFNSQDHWPLLRDLFLPELLSVEAKDVPETLTNITAGEFPVELSNSGKNEIFDILFSSLPHYYQSSVKESATSTIRK